jgi:hypothetical protein
VRINPHSVRISFKEFIPFRNQKSPYLHDERSRTFSGSGRILKLSKTFLRIYEFLKILEIILGLPTKFPDPEI